MSVDVAVLLQELDFRLNEGSSGSGWLLRAPDGTVFESEPTMPSERLTATRIRIDSAGRNARRHRVLHVGRSATAGVVARAESGEIDILTAEPIRLIHAGRAYQAEPSAQPRQVPQHTGKPAWARWALQRYLLLTPTPSRQQTVAEALGTTQQSISRAAQALPGLIADEGEGLFVPDRNRLLEHWREEYPGPGSQEFGWYGLDPVTELVDQAVSVASLLEVETLVSGDVAADIIAPWKLPARGRVYISGPVDLTDDGFVSVPLEEANLITCIPRDPTIWRLTGQPTNDAGSAALRTADAAIVYWDLWMSGDQDSDEAAQQVARLLTGARP